MFPPLLSAALSPRLCLEKTLTALGLVSLNRERREGCEHRLAIPSSVLMLTVAAPRHHPDIAESEAWQGRGECDRMGAHDQWGASYEGGLVVIADS